MYQKLVIAGAGGFIGQAVALALRLKFGTHTIGLSRGAREATNGIAEWRKCDLFSLLDAEQGLEGAEAGIYLVHSMLPSAGLTQGTFYDLDLIAADNFARAAKRHGLKHIVYLGGIVPSSGELSEHLASRLEVQRALAAYGTPVTTLRAGIVVGRDGSSFRILESLVKRLPIMLTPAWTDTPTQPIDLDDMVQLLIYALGRESVFGKTFDVGGPEVLTYRKMIQIIAGLLGRHPFLMRVPLFTPGLSRAWVTLITGAPKNLVKPLVQSLHHPMIAHDRRLQEEANIPGLYFSQSAKKALAMGSHQTPHAFGGSGQHREHDVRSVQRMSLPPGRNAHWVAQEYMRWLPKLLPFILGVNVTPDEVCTFRLFGIPLLVLEYAKPRSTPDRALFYIRGGYLARIQGRGRLEFRMLPKESILLAAIHEFRPRLPWRIYSYTQAKAHLWVMRAFGRHLRKLTSAGSVRESLA